MCRAEKSCWTAFAKKLVEKADRNVARVVLYGSVAKDTREHESDVDAFIVALADASFTAKEAGEISCLECVDVAQKPRANRKNY